MGGLKCTKSYCIYILHENGKHLLVFLFMMDMSIVVFFKVTSLNGWLFLINMCCYCSGPGREKKVVDKYELLYSEYETCMVKGFRIWRYVILFIVYDGFCKIEIILN